MEEKKEIKKRGRKPKGGKLILKSIESDNKSDVIPNIILHLKCSLKYGIVAFITGIVLGVGYLHYGLYWCVGLHALFNFVETSLYTITNTKVSNKIMGGERKTPDDDGMMTALVELIGLYSFYYFGYF